MSAVKAQQKKAAKRHLGPTQARTVANRRLGDAQALVDTGENTRANGAIYLGGIVIDCLLKARLMEKFPFLRNPEAPGSRPGNAA